MLDRGSQIKTAIIPGTDHVSSRTSTSSCRWEWNALPESYRIRHKLLPWPKHGRYCERLAKSHYENFSVATWFPAEAPAPAFLQCLCILPDLDDLGDEVGDAQQSLNCWTNGKQN